MGLVITPIKGGFVFLVGTVELDVIGQLNVKREICICQPASEPPVPANNTYLCFCLLFLSLLYSLCALT